MEKSNPKFTNVVALEDRPTLRHFDFDRIQVAPQPVDNVEAFSSLSLSERQTIVHKLIERVKRL